MTMPRGQIGVDERQPATTPRQPERWWRCPPWCLGDCTGGEIDHFPDGSSAFTGRLHERVLSDVVCTDDERPMRVRVIAERCDNPGDTPTPGQVVLYLEREPMPGPLDDEQVAQLTDGLTDEACRRQLAAFLAGSYDSLSAALPPSHRQALVDALLTIDTAAAVPAASSRTL